MSATNGRGEYAHAILCWRWRPGLLLAISIAHRFPPGFTPQWVAMVPSVEARPPWIPDDARAYALADEDVAYVW